jgi:antitoxin component of MazEF toxin-antitoxin module
MTRTLPFKGKIWKQGNSHVVTLPSDYIDNELIPVDKELQFTVEVTE